MIPYLHFCTYFLQKQALIFCKKNIIFCKNMHIFLALIFCNLLYLFCVKLFSPSEIIFTNDEHVFLRILVTNLRVLCFDIYAIPTTCTPYYQSRVNLVSEICLVNILTFGHEVSLSYLSRNNLLRVLTYVCRHCNIKYF